MSSPPREAGNFTQSRNIPHFLKLDTSLYVLVSFSLRHWYPTHLPFSNILSVYSFHKEMIQISHSYKTTCKNIIMCILVVYFQILD
jgi:hypothetical protein